MIKRAKAGLLLIIWASASLASVPLKPFQSDSLDEIVNDRKGQPFLLVLWSIDCPPCLKELAQLQQMRDQFPLASLVLVATDDLQLADSVQQTLSDFQLDKMDNWIFSDSVPERLRYIVDPAWYGELPRAYFYDASHQRSSHSGSLKKAILEQWLRKTGLNSYSEMNPEMNPEMNSE